MLQLFSLLLIAPALRAQTGKEMAAKKGSASIGQLAPGLSAPATFPAKRQMTEEKIVMKAIVVTDQAAGTPGMTLVERPEPQAAINGSRCVNERNVPHCLMTFFEFKYRCDLYDGEWWPQHTSEIDDTDVGGSDHAVF